VSDIRDKVCLREEGLASQRTVVGARSLTHARNDSGSAGFSNRYGKLRAGVMHGKSIHADSTRNFLELRLQTSEGGGNSQLRGGAVL